MPVKTLLFLAVGRLLIFYIQKSPYSKIFRGDFWTELFGCDLCLGWWVYLGLSFLMGEVWFIDTVYFPVASQILTCSCASFGMWLLSEGWNAKFRELHL